MHVRPTLDPIPAQDARTREERDAREAGNVRNLAESRLPRRGDHVTVNQAELETRLGLPERIAAIPPSALVRGVVFDHLAEAFRLELGGVSTDLDRLLGPKKRPYGSYSVRDFARTFALAGALVESAPHEGMRRLSRALARRLVPTILRVRPASEGADPVDALERALLVREALANHGRARIERRSATSALVHVYDDYCWLESGQRGVCEGILDAVGLAGTVYAELDGPFHGRLYVQWSVSTSASASAPARTP